MNNEKFMEFLKEIGLNENGIREVLQRFDEGRADREDLELLRRFEDSSR